MKRHIGVISAAVMLAACLVFAGCSQPEGSADDNSITVSATGTAYVVPDTASIGVVVEAKGNDVPSTHVNAERAVTEVLAHLRTAGADDAKMHATVSPAKPIYGAAAPEPAPAGYYDDYGNWVEGESGELVSSEELITGYKITTTIRVDDVAMDKLNTMLREAATVGASSFVDFTYSIADRGGAYEQALSAAADAAHAEAETLAQANGVYVGRVVNMVENSDADSLELTKKGDASVLDASKPDSIEVDPGTIAVEASVTASYAIS